MGPVDQARPITFAGRYRRLRRLGTGGMARVFLAEDDVLHRQVAVKQLPSGAPQEALRRFRREARLGASLNHSNVVSIFDTVSDDDSVLIVMEYVDGESLGERLKREAIGREEALSILRQVADALDHAHAQGIVHRDVKPSNILIASDGVAKLADLGIATAVDVTAITGTGGVIGTLAYIAPERLRGQPGDASADVYSLAAVAFEVLSGRRAHPERTPQEVLVSVDSGRAPDLREAMPTAPAAAAQQLASAMGPDPARRPGSAGALVSGLEGALGGAPRRPTPARTRRGPFIPPTTTSRRRSAARPAAILALGAAAALIAGLLFGGSSGPDKKAPLISRKSSPPKKQPPAGSSQGTETTSSGGAGGATPAPAAPSPEPAPPPSGAELNSQGYALIQEGRYDEAIPILRRAVDSFPPGTTDLDYAYALFNLGNALRLAGRPEEAIPVLEQRLQIPNQTATVQRELELARAAAAGGANPAGGGGEDKKKEEKRRRRTEG